MFGHRKQTPFSLLVIRSNVPERSLMFYKWEWTQLPWRLRTSILDDNDETLFDGVSIVHEL